MAGGNGRGHGCSRLTALQLTVLGQDKRRSLAGQKPCASLTVLQDGARAVCRHAKGNSNSHGARPVYSNHLDDKLDSDQQVVNKELSRREDLVKVLEHGGAQLGAQVSHGQVQGEFLIDNLLIRIHCIIVLILVDRPAP